MKKRKLSQGMAPPFMALAVLLLTMMVVMTTSLVVAKYVAAGTLTSSGRVALFSNTLTGPTVDRVAYTYLNIGATKSNADVPFTVTNNSEVMVRYTFYLRSYNTKDVTVNSRRDVLDTDTSLGTRSTTNYEFMLNGTQAYITADGNDAWRVPPKTTGNFMVRIYYRNNNQSHRCRIYYVAEQIN